MEYVLACLFRCRTESIQDHLSAKAANWNTPIGYAAKTFLKEHWNRTNHLVADDVFFGPNVYLKYRQTVMARRSGSGNKTRFTITLEELGAMKEENLDVSDILYSAPTVPWSRLFDRVEPRLGSTITPLTASKQFGCDSSAFKNEFSTFVDCENVKLAQKRANLVYSGSERRWSGDRDLSLAVAIWLLDMTVEKFLDSPRPVKSHFLDIVLGTRVGRSFRRGEMGRYLQDNLVIIDDKIELLSTNDQFREGALTQERRLTAEFRAKTE